MTSVPRPQHAAPAAGASARAEAIPLPSLAYAAPWLARFTPPFQFGSFFAPEDTVLCALATGVALRRARRPGDPAHGAPRRVVELTAGSALVLGAALLADGELEGYGSEVDAAAVERMHGNLAAVGVDRRAHVRRVGLFSPRLVGWLRRVRPAVVACNPPYIPEPPGTPLALVAGAGPRGDRHPRRVLRAAAEAGAPRVVLSWCSLGDPVGVVRTAVRAGYRLERLWAAAIADGEYSGEVQAYARGLATSFLTEQPATPARVARDGAARFAYLLLAGSFVRVAPNTPDGPARARRAVRRTARLMHAFREHGLAALERAHMRSSPGFSCYVVDRGDEIRLRAAAHGPVPRA